MYIKIQNVNYKAQIVRIVKQATITAIQQCKQPHLLSDWLKRVWHKINDMVLIYFDYKIF
ncbi:hypothetical protein T03_16500 [Trichinella britovi]|uniref:Uncharacterized protein n=1 Tax=Trichinella britovi TaxID=45882 RepID=A0A0V1CLQ0_TRIBR|nr:hypothetical protein T03_16500 [Trichinella britovi]